MGLGVALTIDLPRGLDDWTLRPAGASAGHRHRDDVWPTSRVRPTAYATGLQRRWSAFGALPFDRSARATLVVPELLYGRGR